MHFLFAANLRSLVDKAADQNAMILSEAVDQKVREWFPFEEMDDSVIKQLVDESEDHATMEKGLSEFQSMWLVGNRAGTVYSGLESQGLCSVRLQLQGQRLVAMVSTNELRDHFKTRGVRDCLQLFQKMNGDDSSVEIPDVWSMPNLSFHFVCTGDVVFIPAGMLIVEKAAETSVSLRPGQETNSADLGWAGLHAYFNRSSNFP